MYKECSGCDPDKCPVPVAKKLEISSTNQPIKTLQKCPENGPVADCCCPQSCTREIMDRSLGLFTCGERVNYFMMSYGDSQRKACSAVANKYQECSGCDPDKCPVPVAN